MAFWGGWSCPLRAQLWGCLSRLVGEHLGSRGIGQSTGREGVQVSFRTWLGGGGSSRAPPLTSSGTRARTVWLEVPRSLFPSLPSGSPLLFPGTLSLSFSEWQLLGVPPVPPSCCCTGPAAGLPISACPLLLLPSPCPLGAIPHRASLPRQSRSLPTSAPRSGRLLVPRPQSLFDPLLGSEPCDPVGGPRLSARPAQPDVPLLG